MNPSSVDDSTYDREIVIMALMVALGVILHRFEALFPLPTPWIKLGLANLMTLVVLFYLGTREAFVVTLLRVILGSILAGTFLGPAFFLSLAGGLAGTAIMCGIYKRGKGPFSLVGVSICGAYAHTFITAICVYLFSYKTNFLFRPTTFFLLTRPGYWSLDRNGR